MMRADDIERIAYMDAVELYTPTVGEDIDESIFHYLDKLIIFRNSTEAEAMIRVIGFVSHAAFGIDDVQIQLQASIQGHPIFKDIFVVFKKKRPCCFMEVKKSTVYPKLTNDSDETAQALREAHILLCESRDYEIEEIPFVLTNSYVWKFGLAKRKMLKIELKKVMTISIDYEDRERTYWKELNSALRSVIQGKFPSGKKKD